MFNFTTLTVYNDIKTEGNGQNLWVATNSKTPALRIGNTRFDAANIEKIEVKTPSIESLAKVTFDVSEVKPSEGTTSARIVLYIGLSMNSQDAFYANDFVYKGKPLFIEFPVSASDTAGTIGPRVKKIADKYLLLMMGTEKILNVTVNGDAVTFEGVNGYQLIKKAILLKWDPEAVTVDCCTNQGEYVDVITGVPVIYTIDSTTGLAKVGNTDQKLGENGAESLADNEVAILPGIEAFGDYNWIIHNLRLPTAANYYPWSPANRMGEMPIPGQQYTQFIITLVKQRDGIMGEIVGARGTSVTTHVLYVAGKAAKDASVQTTAADKVYKALNTLKSSAIATTADDVLAAPYGE